MSKPEDYSEFLQKKHRMFFRYLDRNGDGKLFRDEILKRAEKFSHINVLNDEESAYTKSCWVKWCDKAFPQTETDIGVTEDQFIEIHRQCRSSEQWPDVCAAIENVYKVLFDRMDSNRDGKMSREELKTYYKSLGAADDKFIDKVFRRLDLNHDGQVVKAEFVAAGMAFWISEDESSGYEIMYDIHS